MRKQSSTMHKNGRNGQFSGPQANLLLACSVIQKFKNGAPNATFDKMHLNLSCLRGDLTG